MDPAIAKPDFELTSRADALFHPARPKTPTRPSKNDEAQKHEKTETVYQSANFVTVHHNPSQLKSQNNFLSRRDPMFGERRKMHVAYPVAARNFFPSPQLWTKFSSISIIQFPSGQKCQPCDTLDKHLLLQTSLMDHTPLISTCYKLAFWTISSK
jgi:hypothetical protein